MLRESALSFWKEGRKSAGEMVVQGHIVTLRLSSLEPSDSRCSFQVGAPRRTFSVLPSCVHLATYVCHIRAGLSNLHQDNVPPPPPRRARRR